MVNCLNEAAGGKEDEQSDWEKKREIRIEKEGRRMEPQTRTRMRP